MSRQLRFFEKNIFDANANEKPTLTTNDNTEGVNDLKTNYKKTYKANPANSSFSKITTPIEYLSFFADGVRNKLKFKNVNITSGESEIIASTQRPAETKRVAVSMSATANLAQVVDPDPTDTTITIPANDITIPRFRYSPSITVEIGNLVRIFSDGFTNRNRYLIRFLSRGRRTLVQAYASLVDFFTSGITSYYFHRDFVGSLRKETQEEQLPPSILEQEETTTFTGGTKSINVSSNYSYLTNPLAETVHYKISGNYRKTKVVKDFVLTNNAIATRLAVPFLQKIQIENPDVKYVKSDGDDLPSEQNFSERIRQFFPDNFEFDASHFDIEHKTIIHRSFPAVVNEEYNVISQTTTATQYQKVTANFICKIKLKSDIVNLLTPEGKSFLFKPVIDSVPNNNENGSFAVYEPTLITYRTGGRHEYRDGPLLEHLTFGQAFADVSAGGDGQDNVSGSPEIISFDDDGSTDGGAQPATGYVLLQNSSYITREVTNGTVSPHSDPNENLITNITASHRNTRLALTGVFQRFGEKVKAELNQYFNFENGRPEVNPENALDINSQADRNLIANDAFLNNVDEVLTDLGLVRNNPIKINGATVGSVTASTIDSLSGSYGLNSEGAITRLGTIPISNTGLNLISTNLNIPLAIEGQNGDTLDILPISFSSLNYSYQIVAFNRRIGDRLDVIVVKQNFEPFLPEDRPMELDVIRIEDNDGNVREYRDAVTIYNSGTFNDSRGQPVDGHPFARFNDLLGRALEGYLNQTPKLLLDWYNLIGGTRTLDNIFRELTEPEKIIKLWVLSDTIPVDTSDDIPVNPSPEQPVMEEDNRQSILSNIDGDFPFINVNSIFYDDTSRRMHLVMGRQSSNAPVPHKTFFGNFRIANRVFGFASSRYRSYSNAQSPFNPYGARVADYSWSTSLNFLQNRKTARISFSKTGTSYTNEVNRQFIVKQSTIETNSYKERSGNILGGLRVKDISFVNGSSFKITFFGEVSNSNFDAIAVRDKDDTDYITRHMKSADATREYSSSDDETSYEWEDLAEFFSLRENKDYTLEMIQNATYSENRFFVTRPLQNNTDAVSNIAIDDQHINFSLQESASQDINRDFNSFSILNSDGTNYIPWITYDREAETIEGNKKNYSYDTGSAITTPDLGDKFNFVFEKKLFPSLQFNIIRMTDNYFDTVVLLNTNLSDIALHDASGVELIHPSDVEELIITTEDNIRHVILNLKNPIASEVVYISSREKFGSSNRRFAGQLLLLKSIGEFSQYPRVTVDSSNSREVVNTQFNLSHVKSLPNAINYQMEFPPLKQEADLLLAQDLYSRVSNYNEFVVWASGGEPSKLRGFKVVDFIKSLCSNDFQFSYVDGRFSSGVTFNMNLVNVY